MEKANMKTYSEHYGCDFFFGECDITCGSTPLSLGEDRDLQAGRIFSLRGLIPLKKILNPAETTVVCESYRFLSTTLLLIEV